MQLKRKFESGEFAILIEMEPPKGVDTSRMVANARRIKDDVDAFVVPEMSNAVMRMSSLGAAMILQKQGMEAVIQVCCRDRNRLALQADLLAAFGCGIPNVMAVTGGGDAKSMAGGVSRATVPTMAGMVAAISGVFANTIVTRVAQRESVFLEDNLTTDH